MSANGDKSMACIAVAYRCMPRAELRDGPYSVCAVCLKYIEAIREWRNAQIDVLRQSSPITTEQQADYFAQHIWPDMQRAQPRNVLLIYQLDGRPIGYGGLVHIAWEHRRAEVSFLLDPAPQRSDAEVAELFIRFLQLMKRLAFEDLGLNRLYTETYAIRPSYIHTLEMAGFVREGRLRNHVRINGEGVDSIVHGCLASDERSVEK